MEFKITKTRIDWDDDNNEIQPVDGAYFKKFDRVERRTVTEEEFDKMFGPREGLWRSKGFDHKTYDNGRCIERKHKDDDSGWFIEVETLEALLELEQKVGHELILSDGSIEIYNDYRE